VKTVGNYRRIWVCGFLFTLTAINYADRVALSVAATPVAREFGLDKVQMGYLLSSFLWAYVLCLIPVGLLVDRFGGKIVNACGIGLWSLATVCTGLAPSYLLVIVSRVVMGIGESTCWPASNRIIREWFPATERALANAIFGAGAAAGPAAGAVGISAIVAAWGWRWGFIVAGSIGFIWLFLWWIFFDHPERVRWLGSAERDKIVNERDGGFASHVAEQPSSSLRYLLSLRSTWGLFLTQGCEVYGGYMLLTWLPSYLQQARGLSVLDAGMLTAIPFGAAAVGAVALGKLSDHLLNPTTVSDGKRRIMIAVMLAGASTLMVIPLINQLWVMILLLSVMRAVGGAGSALNFALVTDLVRSRSDIGKVTSTTVVGGNSFGLCAPIVTGYVVQITGGFDSAFYIAGFLPLIGALATLTMTRNPILPDRQAVVALA
jgi:MFS family permease